MRARSLLLVAVLAVSVAGCGGGSNPDPTAGKTQSTIACDRFADINSRIVAAQSELYGGDGASATAQDLITELKALEDGAPAEVQKALDGLIAGFGQVQQYLADPQSVDAKTLSDLGPQMAADGKVVTEYVTAHCD